MTDAQGHTAPAAGKTAVTHKGSIWISDGYMKTSRKGRGVEMRNTSIITPFGKGADTTDWRSLHPALGAISGRFVIVGDSIISTFTSEDGVHEGCECFIRISEGEYSARGYVLENGDRLSAWSVRLKRESHPERKR